MQTSPPNSGTRALQMLISGLDEKNIEGPHPVASGKHFMIARWDLPSRRNLFVQWSPDLQYHCRLNIGGLDLEVESHLTLTEAIDYITQELANHETSYESE